MRRLLLVPCLAWILALPAVAAEVRGLYEAEVPVAGRDGGARETAVGRALVQVLVKVTGNPAPAASPVIADAVAGAGRLVQQYRYRTVDEVGGAAPQLRLVVRFDPAVVDGVAREAGLPVWGRIRPGVLAWLAVERAGSRDLLGGDDAGGLVEVLRAGAARRGIPLEVPLLDLEDRSRLGVTDVWGGFQDRVRAASARYGSDAELMGRVYAVLPTLWEGKWTLLTGDGAESWSGQADVPEILLEEAVTALADRLAARFAGSGALLGPSDLAVVLTGVDSLEDYARALHYLESLDGVASVSVREVRPDLLRLGVVAEGGVEALRRVVGLGRILAEEASAGDLRFRLLR